MNSPALDLSQAFRIAVEVHGSQRDLQGEPYLFHVMRVAMAMETDEERVVAILHDAIEDTPGSFMNYTGLTQTEKYKRLCAIERSYGVDISRAVFALTRQDWGVDEKRNWCPREEPYLDYIRRVAHNPLATKVKFRDLADNMYPVRLAKLEPVEAERLRRKYYAAYQLLWGLSASSEMRRYADSIVPPTAASSPHPAPDAQS